MTIYLDIVLIENLCMNYIILFATGFIMKMKLHHIRLGLSGLLGGAYAILAYLQILPLFSSMGIKFLLSVAMVYIAFIPKNIKVALKQLVVFYLVSFAMGGCAFALLYFIKPEDIFMINGVYIGTYPLKIALLGGIIGFIVMYTAFKVLKTKMNKKALIYNVEISLEEKRTILKAMLDTGNMLKDPITGIPVIVAEKNSLYEILPDSILDNVEKVMGGDWGDDAENMKYRARFRMIPFHSIGKENGMLLGFKVDEVKIMTDTEEIKHKKIIVCIHQTKLTKANTYSALIGLDMLEGGRENEFIADVKI